MPQLAAFVKELLHEDMYGTEYHSRIQERVATLNLSQLTKMQAHLESVASTATFSYWREANHAVEDYFGGFLQLRQDEKDRQDQAKRDIEKKIEQRLMRKAGLKAEEDKVRGFMERHCEAAAREQVMEEEKERRVQERATLRRAVHVNERRRNRIFVIALLVGIAGVVAAVLLFLTNIALMVAVIAGAAFVAVFLAVFGWYVTRGAPKVVTDKHIEGLVRSRASELRVQAEAELQRKEEEFRQRQVVDKEERRERKRRIHERREIEQQIREMDLLERGEGSVDTSIVTMFESPTREGTGRQGRAPRHPPASLGSGVTWNTAGGGSLDTLGTHMAAMGDDEDDEDYGGDDEEYDDEEDTDDSEYDAELLQGGDSTLLSMGSIGIGGVNSPGLSSLGGHDRGRMGSSFGLDSPLAGGGGAGLGGASMRAALTDGGELEEYEYEGDEDEGDDEGDEGDEEEGEDEEQGGRAR